MRPVGPPVYKASVTGSEELDLTYAIHNPNGTTDIFLPILRREIGLVRLGGDDRNDRDLRLLQGSALDRLLSDKALRSRLTAKFSDIDVKAELQSEGQAGRPTSPMAPSLRPTAPSTTTSRTACATSCANDTKRQAAARDASPGTASSENSAWCAFNAGAACRRREPVVKTVGKPDAGNPHVRVDERGGETERVPTRNRALPRLYCFNRIGNASNTLTDS